ncbi:MAG: glycine cleavage system protein GcvH [Pontimonas sp.]|jgi:glycine cleavage system H protein
MSDVPAHLRYTKDHEWVAVDGDQLTVGITQYAADALGDVVYVDHPSVGSSISAGSIVGEVESTKSVGEIFAPVAGEVVDVNQAVVDDPSLINRDPYGEGWLFKVTGSDSGDFLDADAYRQLIGE